LLLSFGTKFHFLAKFARGLAVKESHYEVVALKNDAPFKQRDLPESMQKVRTMLVGYLDGDRLMQEIATLGLY